MQMKLERLRALWAIGGTVELLAEQRHAQIEDTCVAFRHADIGERACRRFRRGASQQEQRPVDRAAGSSALPQLDYVFVAECSHEAREAIRRPARRSSVPAARSRR